jgi:hypothetical protein
VIEAKFLKSGLNQGTERKATDLVLDDKRFQKPTSALKSRILNGIHPDIGDWSQKTFDLIMTSTACDPVTEANVATLLDDICVVEVKTTRKPIRNKALNNFFFGSTERQYQLARALGGRHRNAFAVLNSDNDYGRPFFVLLTLDQVEQKTRTKRLQYQVNFRSDMQPDDSIDAGPFPVVDVVADVALARVAEDAPTPPTT